MLCSEQRTTAGTAATLTHCCNTVNPGGTGCRGSWAMVRKCIHIKTKQKKKKKLKCNHGNYRARLKLFSHFVKQLLSLVSSLFCLFVHYWWEITEVLTPRKRWGLSFTSVFSCEKRHSGSHFMLFELPDNLYVMWMVVFCSSYTEWLTGGGTSETFFLNEHHCFWKSLLQI